MKLLYLTALLWITCLATAQTPTHLQVGDVAPPINGRDQLGQAVNSANLLQQHDNVVLIFYRGVWCPVCRKHLSALQDSLQMLVAANTGVIVVTPEDPESVEKMANKTDVTFSIIHDVGYQIMNDYGVLYTVSKETVPKWYKPVVRRSNKANGNEDGQLPVPATYVIAKDGTIKYVHYNPDYHQRASVLEIMQQLD